MENPAPLFLIPLITGPMLIAAGWFLQRFPPKSPNQWYGYRTRSSKQSQRHWHHAQQLAGRQFVLTGLIYTPMFLLQGEFEMSEMGEALVAVGALLLLISAIIIRVERSLKRL